MIEEEDLSPDVDNISTCALLDHLAKTCSKPKRHVIDLVGIWEESQDIHNKNVRQTVLEVKENWFRHGADETQWDKLNTTNYVNPACRKPENIARIDQHFIKEAQAGRYFVNDKIKVKCRVPFFIKEEGDDKFRFIPDYSWPKQGVSVNSLIEDREGQVNLQDRYKLVQFVYNEGKTNALGKNDFKSFYRQFPLNSADYSISVYHWRGVDWIDAFMPWGTKRASKIAHYFSIAIEHIAYKYIPVSLQPCIFSYIDDHIFRGDTRLQCLFVHVVYIFVCTKYNVQLNLNKTILCTTQQNDELVGLGLEFDVAEKTVSVTSARRNHIHAHLDKIATLQQAQAKYAQKVVGKCEDIAFIVYPLRVYLRHFRNEIPAYNAPNQMVTITPEIKNACKQWQRALKYLQGRKLTNILNRPQRLTPDCQSDASDKGYALVHGSHWLYGAFHKDEVKSGDQNNISERELLPILVGCQTFGPQWSGYQVRMFIDNQNALAAIVNKDIRREESHKLLIRICETMMEYKFEIFADYIPTEDNIYADALSRLKIKKFLHLCHQNQKYIDVAPMLHLRPALDTENTNITTHQPVTYDPTM